ncbi:MAG TPA: ABC transporter substrate-binding protein [Thermoanaerobaculaceae bacterium]|nr:ABC transporter substrate-binding protein [Thermoanaerobaculaceae bacterium]
MKIVSAPRYRIGPAVALLAAAALALPLLSCGGAHDSAAIRIGVVAEITGDMPAAGASCKSGAELAVEEVNRAGGLEVGGKKLPVELFIEDNAGRADQSAAAAQKLITQQEVVAIVGPNPSRYAIPASEVAESSHVVMIAPWSTNPKTTLDARTGKPKRYVFRSCFIDPFQGRVVANFALQNLKARRAAALYDVASEYNKGIAEIFKQVFEANGGQVVAFETYTTGDKDFSAQLTKIKAAQPDVIFLPNYYSEVPLQIQQAHRLGITTPFLGSDSWGSAEILNLCGKDCDGYYFSTHFAADMATPVAKRFIAAFRTKFGHTPDDLAALTYDAFGLLWQALHTAGKVDRQAVRDALATISNYDGVTGTMRFNEGSGDPIKSAVIVQIKDGKFVWFANANP